ncbi:MAG: hypothetical protein L0I80_00855 [Brevibacterium sp.]|uniref:YqeB family protein n=1 Tax=Brevibacterium sp. TaxID=1701 RepID=UPI00264998A6|nr:hypothetical protein [Brevibacterium sp.]MDN5807483.1 hypothetical protein [Brevibacterium sp.]MDN5833909.1 hypothetical protein [Brevibacterium sp.]MDN5876535.1 hypothetical protein [Brevibacterium sp.]MDN5909620.1 hypothetical protein [Brevibacterium sp.]MDN6122407.1 hypothetical protein [Brevibacterium sp.]
MNDSEHRADHIENNCATETNRATGTNAVGNDGASVFRLGRADVLVIGAVCVSIGVALGFFLPALGTFATKFPIPFGEAIEKLSKFDQAWVVAVRPIIGAALGVIATLVISASTTPLLVGDDEIVVGRSDDHPLRISRTAFSTAYFDGGKLTILTEGGHQAYKGDVEGKKDKVAEAFTSRGYRWGEI